MTKKDFFRKILDTTGKIDRNEFANSLRELLKTQKGHRISIPKEKYNPDGDPDDDDPLSEYVQGQGCIYVNVQDDNPDERYVCGVFLNAEGNIRIESYGFYGNEFHRGDNANGLYDLADDDSYETLRDFVTEYGDFEKEDSIILPYEEIEGFVRKESGDLIRQIAEKTARTYASRKYSGQPTSLVEQNTESLTAILKDIVTVSITNYLYKENTL